MATHKINDRPGSVQQQIRTAVIEANEEHKDSRAYKASALRHRIHTEAEILRAQHAEVTPAGLNYLLPGVEPIHTTPPTEGQARLL